MDRFSDSATVNTALILGLTSDSATWFANRMMDIADFLSTRGVSTIRAERRDHDSGPTRPIAQWSARHGDGSSLTFTVAGFWDRDWNERCLEIVSKIPRAQALSIRLPDPGPPYRDLPARLPAILRDSAMLLRAPRDQAGGVKAQADLAAFAQRIAIDATRLTSGALTRELRIRSGTPWVPLHIARARPRRAAPFILSPKGVMMAGAISNCLSIVFDSGWYIISPAVADADASSMNAIDLLRAHSGEVDGETLAALL